MELEEVKKPGFEAVKQGKEPSSAGQAGLPELKKTRASEKEVLRMFTIDPAYMDGTLQRIGKFRHEVAGAMGGRNFSRQRIFDVGEAVTEMLENVLSNTEYCEAKTFSAEYTVDSDEAKIRLKWHTGKDVDLRAIAVVEAERRDELLKDPAKLLEEMERRAERTEQSGRRVGGTGVGLLMVLELVEGKAYRTEGESQVGAFRESYDPKRREKTVELVFHRGEKNGVNG